MSTVPTADPDGTDAPALARRTVVLGGAVASAAVLAACSTSSSVAGGPTPAESTPPSTTDPSAVPSTSSGEASGATVLGPVAQVPVGGGALFDAGGQPIMVTQPSAGTFHGFSAVCPHEGCVCNTVDQGVIVCPCHGSTFSTDTGDVLSPPARSGLQKVEVVVQGSDIVLV